MGKRMTVLEASRETGLTPYTLRLGIKQGRYPHIRTGGSSGKILIDIALLERALEREAMSNAGELGPKDDNIIQYGQLRRVSE